MNKFEQFFRTSGKMIKRGTREWLWSRPLSHIRYRIAVGSLILLPIFLTYLIVIWAFGFLDGVVGGRLAAYVGIDGAGTGVISMAVLIYIAGLITPNALGQRVIRGAEVIVQQIPVIRHIYKGSRFLVLSLSGQSTTGFNRVVMIEYPHPGLWALGFLMGRATDEEGKELAIVYIPTAPSPTSGWVSLLRVENVYDTNMSVNALMQMVFSGGIMVPSHIEKRPLLDDVSFHRNIDPSVH